MEYGKYDETARYFRRMEELAEQLAAADPDALEPLKVKASVKATLGDFQMDRIGDAEAALKFFDEALVLRRQWMAREPSNDEAKRGVANILGAIARARPATGRPGQGSRTVSRRDRAARPVLSGPGRSGRGPPRTRRAPRQARRPERLPRRPEGRSRIFPAGARAPRRRSPRRTPTRPRPMRDVLLSLEKLGTHELIYSRDPKIARRYYQEALDGFLERLKAEPASVPAKMDVALAHYYVATADLRAGDRDSAMAHYRECRDIREELAKDPKTKLSSLDLMLALARTGDHKRASEIAEGMIKEPPLDARIYFHSACGFALSAGAAVVVAPLRRVDSTGPPLHGPRRRRPPSRPEARLEERRGGRDRPRPRPDPRRSRLRGLAR